MQFCHACKKELSPGRGIGRREVCATCGADLHVCLNCKFYDRAVSRQCREPLAELVKEKSRANFCDFFIFTETAPGATPSANVGPARKALEDLFKK
jgi:hypothetical protein